MIISKDDYIDIQKDVVKYTSELSTQKELDSFSQHIESKLSDFAPTMMIYGAYNAGKSSLLNALFGKEEIAKTGDAPETKEVHEYEYDGYTIFDTPGLNANIEDDTVTKEHLEKSEIIMFVLSSDGSFEEDYIYNKISEVVKAKKPIIVVINNKNGLEPESLEAKELIIKLNENLKKIGDRNGIDKIENKVDLCMVNAKSALKAKLENKNILLKKSNILQLEGKIESILENAGKKEVINALNNYIQNFVAVNIDRIDNKIDNVEVQKIEELVTYLEKLKQSSEVKAKNIVTKKIPLMKDTLTTMLLSEGASQSSVDSYISENTNVIISEIESLAKNIESNLSTKIDEFNYEFSNISTEYETAITSNNTNNQESDSFITDEISQKVATALKDKRVIEKATVEVLKKAKDLLPKNVMHGKGLAWISKAANKVATVATVALEAYNMYSAYEEHQQMVEAERSRTIGAKNSADSITNSIQSSLNSGIDEMIIEIFNDLIINYKDASKKLNKDNSSLLANKSKLQSVLTRL